MILNEKENKEATAICFEKRILKKKNKELLGKVSSKIYGSNSIMEKTQKKIWFLNISEYHLRTIGLKLLQISEKTLPIVEPKSKVLISSNLYSLANVQP